MVVQHLKPISLSGEVLFPAKFLRSLIIVLLYGVLCCFHVSASQNNVLNLKAHNSATPLGKHLDVYMGADGGVSIDEILILDKSKWASLNSDIPNLGHSSKAVWLRLNILNDSISVSQLLLSFELPTMNDYQVFVINGDSGINHFQLGDVLPYNSRIVQNRNFVIPLRVETKQKIVVYLRLKTHESLQIPLYLRDEQNFALRDHQSTLTDGLYFGIMFIMALYNLILFFSVKDRNYFYFSFYIFSAAIYQLAKSGLGFQHIWSSLPLVNNYVITISVSMMSFSLSIFMQHFLQIDKSQKLINFTLRFIMVFAILVPILGLFSLHYTTSATNSLALITITSGMVITIRRYYDGLKYAKLFVFGFGVLLFFLLMLILNKIGMIPINSLTENGSQIGDTIAALLMSMALAERINFIQQKRVTAEQEAFKNERRVGVEKEKYLQLKIAAKEEEIQAKKEVYIAHAESKAKSEFLATMSHEIRTPMNGVLGIAEVLSDTDLNQQQKYYVNMIRESGNSLLNVINDILNFSKIEAGKVNLELVDFDLNQLCQECISSFSVIARNKSIDLTASIKHGTPIYLYSDPTRLKQILLNLLSNAFKFTSAGSIALSISRMPEINESEVNEPENSYFLKFEVKDTGIGIPDNQKSKLFAKFSQADSSTTRKYGGTGLGLAICKQLSELFGGEIGLISEENIGTTFWFTARVSEASDDFINENYMSRVSLKNIKVLFVDDSPAFIDSAKETAMAWGMSVETAFSAEECLQKLSEAYEQGIIFDIISLDMLMPGKTGIECAEIINQNPVYKKSKILLLTSMETLPDKNILANAGVNQALQKPASASFLLETFLQLLGDRSNIEKQMKNQPLDYMQYFDKLSGKVAVVAEDNITNQVVIKKMLDKLGVSVTIANDGKQAYQLVKEKHSELDFILMDCEMPNMDGYQTTRMIRDWEENQRHEPLPIIALTAHALIEYREKAMESGMDSHISKPVNIKGLGETLVEVLT